MVWTNLKPVHALDTTAVILSLAWLHFVDAAPVSVQVAMFVLYAATCAGFIILVVQFINILTKVTPRRLKVSQALLTMALHPSLP